MNIKDKKPTDLLSEINEKAELKDLYQQIISEYKNSGEFNFEYVGKDVLSIYTANNISEYIVVNEEGLEPEKKPEPPTKEPEEKEPEEVQPPVKEPEVVEPPKVDIPEINIKPLQPVPEITKEENFNYDDYKNRLVKVLNKDVLEDGYSTAKANYDKIFNSSTSQFNGRDFIAEIKETNSLEELDVLYNNLIKDLQQPNLDKLSTNLPKIREKIDGRVQSKYEESLPKENGFDKFINDLASNNEVIRDTRKHRYYDMSSIYLDYSDMIQYTAKIEEQFDRLYYGYYSEYYDLNQVGHRVNDILLSTNLNNYKEFTLNKTVKDYLFKAFQSQSIPTIAEYPPLIKQIFSSLPDEAVEDKAKESYYLELFEKPISYDKAMSVMMELVEISSKYGIG